MQREKTINTYVFWSHECLFAQTYIDLWQIMTTTIIANEWKDWTTIYFWCLWFYFLWKEVGHICEELLVLKLIDFSNSHIVIIARDGLLMLSNLTTRVQPLCHEMETCIASPPLHPLRVLKWKSLKETPCIYFLGNLLTLLTNCVLLSVWVQCFEFFCPCSIKFS